MPTLRMSQLEELGEAHLQRSCDPHDRIERRVRFSSLDLTDKRLTNSGALGQIPLGHVQRKPSLFDLAAESVPELRAVCYKGLRFRHGSLQIILRSATKTRERVLLNLPRFGGCRHRDRSLSARIIVREQSGQLDRRYSTKANLGRNRPVGGVRVAEQQWSVSGAA